MDVRYEEKYHNLEEQHWWFRARRHMVFSLIQELKLFDSAAILEVGCSGGPLLLQLKEVGYTNLTGIDVSEEAILLGKKRGLQNISVMDGADLNFSDGVFDLLVASDVLEHIKDDSKALQEWTRVLKPGGKMIVFVPAFQHLWSGHDIVNHHYRRYTKAQLKTIVTNAGMQLKRSSYWNFSLYFPTWLVRRLLNNLTSKSTSSSRDDLQQVPSVVNKMLTRFVKMENTVLKKIDLPVGVSVFVVAEKQ